MWTVENAIETLVWMQILLCVFDKMKTDIFKSIIVDKALDECSECEPTLVRGDMVLAFAIKLQIFSI